MPLIDGKKMACVPCIRGHRSTKCSHANDRVMVPVRKPGRPLSSCACPPGQICTCGSLKVAIPRKKNCNCAGPNSEHASHEGHQPTVKPEAVTPAQTPNLMPTSPAKAAKQTFRIQKPTSTTNGAQRNSVYALALARMDPAQVNTIANPTALGLVQPVGPPTVPTSGSDLNNAPRSGCCGGGESRTGTSPNFVPTQPPQQPVDDVVSHMFIHHSQSGQPQFFPYGASPLVAQDTMYYPPRYGTWDQPVTYLGYTQLQLQQQQVQEALLAQRQLHLELAGQTHQQLQLEQALTVKANGDPAPVGPIHNTAHAIEGVGQGVSHQCVCGPGCECIGCVSHPFNAQTLQYVNEAYNIDVSKAMVDMLGGGNNGVAQQQTQANNTNAASDDTTLPTPPHYQAQMQGPESLSPQVQAETPSDTSGLGEEQTFPASDFLFVDMSSCNGQLATCPCGDDCECDGCTIHNSQLMLAIEGQQTTLNG